MINTSLFTIDNHEDIKKSQPSWSGRWPWTLSEAPIDGRGCVPCRSAPSKKGATQCSGGSRVGHPYNIDGKYMGHIWENMGKMGTKPSV